MLSLFNNNRIGSSLLLLVYVLVLRIPAFLDSGAPLDEHSLIFENGLIRLFESNWVNQIITALIVFIEAAMVNRIAIRNRLYHDINLYPGVMYILLLSFTPANYHLHLFLLANFIILLSFMELFHVYKIINSKGKIFNIGVLVSFVVCLTTPFYIFYIFYLISLASLRSFKLQEKIQLILGYVAPLFVVAVAYYWYSETLCTFLDEFLLSFGFASISLIVKPWDYIIVSLFAVILLSVILKYGSFIGKKNIQGVKKINILYWFLFTGILSAVFQAQVSLSQFIILAIPLSILLGMRFTNVKNGIVRELVHIVLFAGSLYLNYNILLSI